MTDDVLLRSSEAATLVLGLVSLGVLVDGALMLLVGPGALLPPGAPSRWIPAVTVGAGGIGALGAFAILGRRIGPILHAATPRMYPFAATGVNAGVYLAVVVGAVVVFHGFFDIFTAAHNGGNVGAIPDQGAVLALLIAASALLWVLTVYAVLTIHRVIQLGRSTDAVRRSTDVYGRPVRTTPLRVGPDERRRAAPPVPALARPMLLATTVLIAFPISAGIQVVELSIEPAPALLWLGALPFTVLFTIPLSESLRALDRGLRGLEGRALAGVSGSSSPDETSGPGP